MIVWMIMGHSESGDHYVDVAPEEWSLEQVHEALIERYGEEYDHISWETHKRDMLGSR